MAMGLGMGKKHSEDGGRWRFSATWTIQDKVECTIVIVQQSIEYTTVIAMSCRFDNERNGQGGAVLVRLSRVLECFATAPPGTRPTFRFPDPTNGSPGLLPALLHDMIDFQPCLDRWTVKLTISTIGTEPS